MEIIYHGHSCVQIKHENHSLIIDPWIKGNPASITNFDDIEIDTILITHGHNDHVGDAYELARKYNALIISTVEIADYFENKNVRTFGLQPGGQYQFNFGTVKMTQAIHGSTYTEEDGTMVSLGLAGGFILTIDGKRLYHAGDTALFSDMALIKEIDCAFIPIGDVYTMGIDDATRCVELIQPRVIVPIHYNTFDLITQNPQDFENKLSNYRVVTMVSGDRLDSSFNLFQ